ncbi:hypothetical protein BU23DRAFT_548858 [Bimuria novae-zelandiae CBS 107.79]|uniref:Transcriptional regulator n=1 Tax=Bimuria novae-zelandiae CBS 107.79 TaxID=1447943 RepID=A0A6A5W2H6_9PLEO|nr:hypothetical protein BU23DRAFT_548858 [Bimuria novae-zelandiae CBS 107.79]
MSDSETDMPSVTAVSDAIRDVVISLYKAGDEDALTVNGVRIGAEQKLGVSAGFLKKADWKDNSKRLIKEAVDRYCGDEPTPAPSPKKNTTKAKPKAKPEPRKRAKAVNDSAPRGTKRKAAVPAKKPKKQRKTASSDEESLADSLVEDAEPSEAESEPPKKQLVRRQKQVVEEDSDEEDTPRKAMSEAKDKDAVSEEEAEDAPSVKEPERPATPPPAGQNVGSESEMSDVIDDSPPAKNRRMSKIAAEKPGKAAKGAKAKPKAAKAKAEDDPDQAEIKRLQGWLVKCGIRKVWGKELKDCETPKEKIRHLKGMLKDAGMDGKYSVEKAAKIKEQREFAKDLEDIKAGAAAWGETSSTGRPRRAAASRPVKPTVFPDLSDEDIEDKAGDEKDQGTDDDDDDDDEVQGDSGSDDSGTGKDDEEDGEDSD